jgi:hypothetical protein
MLAGGKMLLAILRDLEQGRYMDHIKHRIITSLPSIQKMRDHLPSKSTRIGNFSDPLISSTNALHISIAYLWATQLKPQTGQTDLIHLGPTSTVAPVCPSLWHDGPLMQRHANGGFQTQDMNT